MTRFDDDNTRLTTTLRRNLSIPVPGGPERPGRPDAGTPRMGVIDGTVRDVAHAVADTMGAPRQRVVSMTTAVRGLPDGPASAILLEQLRTRLRWWLPRLCVSLIQPDSRGHDPYLLVTAADRDGAVVVDPADGSYRWRGTGELVGTAEGMVHTIQQIAQQMGVFTAEPVRGHPHLPPQPSEPSLGMLPVQQRPSTPAEDLARLRADFGPYGWMFVHDPFHQVWHALRGRQERLNASCAAELRTALGRHPGTRRPGRTPPWGQH